MPLSSEEALASLAEAENARRRSAQLYGYTKASPHLIMWGIIWVLGYGGTGLSHQNADYIWAALVTIGICGSVYFGRRSSRYGCQEHPYAWRAGALAMIILFFVGATYTVMWPVYGPQLCAFPALITGTVYAGVGLWAGMRYVVTGILVLALTLFGFFFVHEIEYWMAFIGGGSMILAGIWFRKV
jgi:hypothetical protein